MFHLLQFWVNLPQEFKMTEPKYQNVKNQDIPVIKEDGIELRIIAGELKNIKSPVSTFTNILTVHGIIENNKGISIPIPQNISM